jgi:Na+-transporting methylmalonyl-CoA/oxaloacetate decarboxylase beta subunit
MAFVVPSVIPLMGMLMSANLMKESGVAGRLADMAQDAVMNIVAIFLGVSVGVTMEAGTFLTWRPGAS